MSLITHRHHRIASLIIFLLLYFSCWTFPYLWWWSAFFFRFLWLWWFTSCTQCWSCLICCWTCSTTMTRTCRSCICNSIITIGSLLLSSWLRRLLLLIKLLRRRSCSLNFLGANYHMLCISIVLNLLLNIC